MGVQDPAEADNGTTAVEERDLSARETDVLQRIADRPLAGWAN
jgi:hypothetical protein